MPYFQYITKFFLPCAFLLGTGTAFPQRQYAPASVLSTGTSYKFSVGEPGVYRVTAALLAQAGINTSGLASSAIRLYGTGGQMLPENNAVVPPDDLPENAIEMFDGGDGQFSGSDYFLFYAPGPDKWLKDSINRRFVFEKNIYSQKAYYYIILGGTGKRIPAASPIAPANTVVNSYNARFAYEKDMVNLLSGGKEWLGEEFAAGQNTRVFDAPFRQPDFSTPFYFSGSVVSRSAGNNSVFNVQVNNQLLQQASIAPVTGNALDPFAQAANLAFFYNATQPLQQVRFTYAPGSINAQGWLNRFEIHNRCLLDASGAAQFTFRDWNSVSPGSRARFQIQTANTGTRVWEVTSPQDPVKQNGQLTGTVFTFESAADYLKEYVVFDGSSYLSPEFVQPVPPQNLHAQGAADMLIITHPLFLSEARRLAQHHATRSQLTVHTVTTEEIYNEFASGTPDPAAIRNYAKMGYDRFRNSVKPLRYILLFGDASFDYGQRISPNTNLVPGWQNSDYLNPLQSYVSDDFFGFLDDTEDINNTGMLNLLDAGIGRLPVTRADEARACVDKIIAYSSVAAFGSWRNNITLLADDEDGNLHLNDTEALAQTLDNVAPLFGKEKIYLDAYRQESGAGGSRYPLVNNAINAGIFNGTLIWNYNGHGGYRRLAEEAILDAGSTTTWKNEHRLPLFLTATCDFAPYDNPLQFSLGEQILMMPKAGAIALLTTTRPVFSNSNRIMANNYYRQAFQRNANGVYPTLGAAVMLAKNQTYSTLGDVANNRKFTLLGDPALTLAFPQYQVVTTKVNGLPYSTFADTLSATKTMVIEGEVRDLQGQLLTNFNGTVSPSVYDQPRASRTLANDPGSVATTYPDRGNILFRGKATVTGGLFSFRFIAPKDMQYAPGTGSISYYASNENADAQGISLIASGGQVPVSATDTEGPEIEIWLNDDKFVNEGITNLFPVLIVRLTDSSGINTSGWGVGHEITAVLDGRNSTALVLNPFFETDLDNFKTGQIKVPLGNLAPGRHEITVKAWDVYNNPSEKTLVFHVTENSSFTVNRVLNYPNPFTTHTTFWFDHNRPGEDLRAQVQVFTITGKIVKTLVKTINTPGNRSCDIEWNGKDDYGDRLARGIYIYRLSVQTPDGQKVLKTEKMAIL